MGFVDKLKTLFQSSALDVEARFELSPQSVSGTMSSFYRARDRSTGEIVGLKLCDREKLEQFESRFKGLGKPTEGEIAVRMKHPAIVETRQHGVTTKGLRYLIMEFLDGPGLHSLIHAEDTLLEGKRVGLIRQMAEALEYVHKAEFIHRDVCPRNFICSPDGASLKLIDFGLTVPASPDFMKPGNRTGTPLYHAPEISRRRPTDARVDIFALGVTAFQICTYQLPWPTSEQPAVSALAYDTTPPRDILELRPKLNRTLAAAIMQCMRPNPADRPQTMGDFLRLIFPVRRDDE
ncbi:MAG: serine/threonine protein kinase [Pirellulaceae bacterium]